MSRADVLHTQVHHFSKIASAMRMKGAPAAERPPPCCSMQR